MSRAPRTRTWFLILKLVVRVTKNDIKFSVYSGTPLLWTPYFRGKFTLREHIWDTAKRCPYFIGVFLREIPR